MSSQLILIVEESEHTRAFLAEQLAADGYEVLLADSRRRALALLGTHRPHLVLADLNGQTLALLDAVRRGAATVGEFDPHTPMIVLTAARTSSRAFACSTAAATTWSPSRSPTPSCADGSARSCAEQASRDRARSAGSGR